MPWASTVVIILILTRWQANTSSTNRPVLHVKMFHYVCVKLYTDAGNEQVRGLVDQAQA